VRAQVPALQTLLASLGPASPLFHALTRCDSCKGKVPFLSPPDVAQRGFEDAASAQHRRAAELLDPLLRAAGVDTTVPIRILDGLSGLCGPDTTSASVAVLMRSLVGWVTDAIANAAAERTQAQIHMFASVIYSPAS
jgi:hypothetical protein